MTKKIFKFVKWDKPWDYAEWKVVVLAGAPLADEWRLQSYFTMCAEPADAIAVLNCNELYKATFAQRKAPKVSRLVVLGLDRAEQRLAQALWRECARLLARRLTPEAKALVLATREKVEEKASL